ncbi:MAG: MbnP family protein [Chitinophagaceae bacterium]
MKLRVTKALLLLVLPLSLSIISCQKKLGFEEGAAPGLPSPVELQFKNIVNRFDDLHFDSTYTLGLNFIKYHVFKYYISNVEFVNTDGDTIKIPDTYFLVDHSKPESLKARFNVPSGAYYGMSFLIGIDSARNFKGPQIGPLDPALGMYMNPNDGYIMAKLEGTIALSPLPGNVFIFHPGGVKAPYSVLSRRHFKLGGYFDFSPGRKVVVSLTADVRQWFSPNNAFGTTFSCTTPGQHSYNLGQNYYKMFEFVSLRYE